MISTAVLAGVVISPAEAAPQYQSCRAVNAVYPSGVAVSQAAASAVVAAKFQRPIVNRSLYNRLVAATPSLDRQKNGVACEVRISSVPVPAPTANPTVSPTPAPTASPTATPSPSGTPIPLPSSEPTVFPTSPPLGEEPPVGSDNKLTTTYNRDSEITARLQWNANYGYCGETSFITALMLNGGYTSQWTARTFALGGGHQWDEGSQIMIGENQNGVTDQQVATSMLLTTVDYDNTSESNTNEFLSWIKKRFLLGDTVIIGVYNNVPMLDEQGVGAGDPTYDHIVPVVKIGSDHPLDENDPTTLLPPWTYYNSDIITISDNGLYTPVTDNVPGNSPENPARSAFYTFNFYDWQNYRAGANTYLGDPSTYHLYSAPIFRQSGPAVSNWGTAVTGIVDTTTGGPVALRVKLTADKDNEGFHNQEYMHTEPAGTAMTLTATAKPEPGTAYNVYIYESFADVPTGNFNTAAVAAGKTPDHVIPTTNSGTWSHTLHITTADTRIYRIVPVGAP